MALQRAWMVIFLVAPFFGFRIAAVEAMTYQMTVRSLPEIGGKCVSIRNESVAQNVHVLIWDCDAAAVTQTLSYDDQTQELKFGTNCVEVLGQGATQDEIGVGPCNGAITQRWSMVAAKDNYQIVGANSLCIDIGNGMTANGTSLHLSKCVPDNTTQVWTLVQASTPSQPIQSTSHATNPIQSVLESHGLMAKFAEDCTREPSESNEYIVHRLIDSQRVERDQMKSPAVRSYTASVEKAEEVGTNEVAMDILITETVIKQIMNWRMHLVTKVERDRIRLMEATPLTGPYAGQANIVDGRAANGGRETHWLTKCK